MVKLLKREDVAKVCSVKVGAVDKWRERKVGPPYIRLAEQGSIRYPEDALNAWVASRLVVNGATVNVP